MKYYLTISFENAKKTYFFETENKNIKAGDHVVVDTVVGRELGLVIQGSTPTQHLKFDLDLKPIVRLAVEDDFRIYEQNKQYAEAAFNLFNSQVKELNLNMNLLEAQYTLDRTKVLFTYASDERVDFRELLKVLAVKLRCRIELRQINSRERAQLIGGIGTCGLPLCCTTFLKNFDSISLNRAKNQMLSINIPKLSGQCGKLMCCLKFEDDYYTQEKKKFPAVGTRLKYEGKEFKITSFNILTKVIKLESPEDVEFLPLDDVNKLLWKQRKK